MKLFVFAGSARQGSFNRKLATAVTEKLEQLGHSVTNRSLADYDLRLYHGDWEDENGVPEDVRTLKQDMGEADGAIIVSPEYNGSIPGTVKNAIDWISRPDKPYDGPAPIAGKKIAIMSASPGYFGGVRMQRHLSAVLSQLGANIYGKSLGVPKASAVFDDNDALDDEKTSEKIDSLLEGFIKFLD